VVTQLNTVACPAYPETFIRGSVMHCLYCYSLPSSWSLLISLWRWLWLTTRLQSSYDVRVCNKSLAVFLLAHTSAALFAVAESKPTDIWWLDHATLIQLQCCSLFISRAKCSCCTSNLCIEYERVVHWHNSLITCCNVLVWLIVVWLLYLIIIIIITTRQLIRCGDGQRKGA